MSNGVIANAASVALTARSSQTSQHEMFVSGIGNALGLIANERQLLIELDKLIGASGRLPPDCLVPCLLSLACRRSQLLDHACFRGHTKGWRNHLSRFEVC
jgi:hypothetical protein